MVLVCIHYLLQRVKRQYQPLSAKIICHEQVHVPQSILLIRRIAIATVYLQKQTRVAAESAK